MPTLGMPNRPHIDSFRRQARDLQRALRAGDTDAMARLARHHRGAVPDDAKGIQLSLAQLVVAREYGFTSWPALTRYLDTVAEHGWDTELGAAAADEPAQEFCRLACMTYSREDGPARWARARELLVQHPDLTKGSIWAAVPARGGPGRGRERVLRPSSGCRPP
ncbi:hypothetical protein K1W54_17955, partial [Micromonospora sp. CPCC 205371]|nr:hypothetical protein [Micromonospora sp. CPCC 205371]